MSIKQLHYGDNLPVLQAMEDNFVDLIYLDPPFNSNRDYFAVFDNDADKWDTAQLTAFEDSWHWNMESEEALDILRGMPYHDGVSKTLDSFIEFLGKNDVSAYLAMMAPRLIEMHRVLKDTGSFYLHCDSTVGHYLKIILDQIFGKKNFKNEIIWKRTYAHSSGNKFGRNTDKIFLYTKSKDYQFYPVYCEYDESYIKKNFRHEDERGRYQKVILTGMGITKGDSNVEWKGYTPSESKRHWSVPRRIVNKLVGEKQAKKMSITERLDLLYENDYIVFSKNGIPRFKQYLNEMSGVVAQECWTDINPIGSQAKEKLGYPTQKPLALLERIIKASSSKGDVVLDPFCGCGTSIAAAQKLKRDWIGIDITPLAINVIEKRMSEHFKLKVGKDFQVVGDPADYAGAKKLANEKDKYKFENWVLRLLNCIPSKFKIEKGKVIPLKGADGGFDGFAKFHKKKNGDFKGRLIAEVKTGKVGRRDIDIFAKCMEREKADLGIFVVLSNDSLSKDGISEAGKAGFYTHEFEGRKIPKIQIWSIENYFNGIYAQLPFGGIAGHIKAEAIDEEEEIQDDFFN